MEKYFIYNLVFPKGINELAISGYHFKKIENLEEQNQFGHQITATLEIPIYESNAILDWTDKETKHIEDILLLLSILNGKDIFRSYNTADMAYMLTIYDNRRYGYGYELMLSIEPELVWKHKLTEEVFNNIEFMDNPNYSQINIGLEKSINNIIKLLASEKWREQYKGGHFLFLYQQAIRQQPVDSSFILCWTIWEHIFTLHNQHWLDVSTIEKFIMVSLVMILLFMKC